MARIWLVFGSIAGFLAVALSAYAAHGLVEAARGPVGQALNMQGWHALALLAVGFLAERRMGRLPHLAGGAFGLGMLLFCGAVWWGALGGAPIGPVAPVGGTLLMLGWVLLAIGAVRR